MKKIFSLITLSFTISISLNAQWEIGNNPNRQYNSSVKLYNETNNNNIEIGVSSCDRCFNFMAKAGDGVVRVRNGGNLILAIPTADINDARSVMIASEGAQLFKVTANGKVQIGTVTTPGDYRLYVERGILTERVKVSLKTTTDWADYVFAKKYKLMPLSEVEKFVKTNNHLPNIPSAEQVVKEGIDLGKMDAKLLEKIEELTLYVIDLDKKVKKLEAENRNLKAKIK